MSGGDKLRVRVFYNGGRTYDCFRVQFDHDDMHDGELLLTETGRRCTWVEGRYPRLPDEVTVPWTALSVEVRKGILAEYVFMQQLLLEHYGGQLELLTGTLDK